MLARLVVLSALVASALLPTASRADAFESALASFAAEELNDIEAGVRALASTAHPQALAVLEALRDRKLRVLESEPKLVVIESGSKLLRASDGAPLPSGRSRGVVLNNVIRRSLSAAIAQHQIASKDDEVRRAAAEALRKSPNPELLGALQKAHERERNLDIRQSFGLALADLELASGDPSVRLRAVQRLTASGEMSAKPKLEALVAQGSDGAFSESDPRVREAAQSALSALRWKELTTRLAGDLLYGLSLGSVLLLAALGLAITFGLMGVINMAHGEMLMLGAYATYVVQIVFQRFAPSYVDGYVLVALPVSFAVCALVGVLIERSVLRFLYGRPLETLLATWGVSLALIQTVRLVFGAQNVSVAAPSYLSGGVQVLEGVVLPYNRLAIVCFGALVVALVWLILTRTRLGLHVRAVTQNRSMAACMGIVTERVDMWTFAVGSGVAGLGGVALSQIGNVGPELGQGYIVDSFMVVVLGGVGKLAGTVLGAFGLGIVNKLLEPISGAVLGKILVLGLIILFIQKRPQGIFALKGRAVEG